MQIHERQSMGPKHSSQRAGRSTRKSVATATKILIVPVVISVRLIAAVCGCVQRDDAEEQTRTDHQEVGDICERFLDLFRSVTSSLPLKKGESIDSAIADLKSKKSDTERYRFLIQPRKPENNESSIEVFAMDLQKNHNYTFIVIADNDEIGTIKIQFDIPQFRDRLSC